MSTQEQLTDFERRVLEKILAGNHPVLEALHRQMRGCRVKARQLTGCGFFTELDVDRTLPAAATPAPRIQIGDVRGKIVGLEHGIGFLLFVNAGYLDVLEGYSYEESWPDSAGDSELTFTETPRDVTALGLDQ